MASAVNEAYRARKIVSGGHTIPLWPGDKLPATYDRTTRTLTIRWRTASAFLDVLVTVLAGVAAGGIAVWLGLPLGAAAVVAVAAAFGAGFAIVIDYMLSWAFLGPSSGVANPGLGTIIFVAGLGVLLVGVLRSKPSI